MRGGDTAGSGEVISRALRSLARLIPTGDRGWSVVVVLDDQPSMAVWAETVEGFLTALRSSEVFADVVAFPVDTSTADPGLISKGAAGQWPADNERWVVLVLTDGTGAAWHSDAMLPLVHQWGQRHPLALIHLLPQQQWYRTGVRPRRLHLQPPAPGAANAALTWRLRDAVPEALDDYSPPAGSVPAPVLEAHPHWLLAWTRLLLGEPATLPAVLAPPAPPRGLPAYEQEPAPDARTRVREFTSWATPTALTLATHLAAAPLNLPVIRLVQRELVPDSGPSHLAEILNSGLLHPVAPRSQVADAGRVTFEFERGVRAELLAVGRRADAVRVLRVVHKHLGASVPAVRGLSHAIDDPDTAPLLPVTPENEPFVRVERTVLRALSGRYLARSRRLDLALGSEGTAAGTSGNTTTANGPRPVTMTTPAVADEQTPTRSGGSGVSSSTVAEVAESATPERPANRAPLIWGNVPPRNPNFTGRESLLDDLHDRMRSGTTAVLPQALHGMGGVGKSQLAVEYVYRHQGDYDLVWWIPSERTTQVAAELVELAQRMDLPVGPEANTAVPAVREALRLGQPYARWLLVFDNAESPEAIRRFFPSGGPGSIMVTSRNPQWANIARPLEVDVFSRSESIELLRNRGPELEEEAADRLAEALGDLPLALEQAAAWRAETGMPADEYLRLFEEKRTELLEVSPPLDYQLPVAAAWNVSLDRLSLSHLAALRLLQVCSFFAPEPIPRTMIAGARSADIHPELNEALRDPMRLNKAIRDINRYALAKIDHRTNSIQMHRLIQAVLIDRMSESERESMRRSAHLLLASNDRNDPNSPANWRTYAELYPHLMASEAFHSPDPWVQQLVDNVAMYLYWWGDHDSAHDLSQRAYQSRRERLGPEHPSALRIGRWLGFMLFVLGRFAEAARLNAELLADHQRATSDDTEELLAAIGAVAADRRVAGDFKSALEIDEDLYQRHVRALGMEDPATLNAAHNLAVSVRLNGDLARARQIDEENWQRRVRLFGEYHTVTLESTRNLIIDRRELGEYVAARAAAQDVVDRLRQQLSPGHPQTLRALRSLSSAIRKAGDHRAALEVSEEVREAFATRYGEDHPDTVAATLNLSIDLRQVGELDSAVQVGEQAHQRYRQLVGDDHPHTVAATLNLAVTQRLRGNVALARRLNEEGLALLLERFDPDHPLCLGASINLASDLYAQGEFAAAYERDRETAERLRRVFGEDHPTTLICLGNLAMDLQALGREEEAREVHADAVARLRAHLGSDHPATVVVEDLTVRGNCDLDPMPL